MKGFTLIELLIVVAMVALLASVAAPLAELGYQRGKESELRHALREIRTAIDEYKRLSDEGKIEKKADESGYPASLAALVDGVQLKTEAKDEKIYFLRRIPKDPLTGEAWGLRSFKSPANDPQAGKDVFDVFSKSDETGLNRVPYREW